MSYVNENEITKQIKDLLSNIQIPEHAFEMVSEKLREHHEDQKKDFYENITVIESEIKKNQTRKEKVYEDYLDGKITEEFYEKKFKEYDVKLKLNQERRESLELINDDHFASASHLLTLAKTMPSLFEKANQEQKRSLINLVVSNLELDGSLLRWKYKKPFDMMASCNEMNSWLSLQVTNLL